MTKLRQRMLEDLRLRGFSHRTVETYVGAVRGLAKFYMRPPDALNEEEVRRFFLHLVDKGRAPATIRTYLHGIRFLYEVTLGREWEVFQTIRPRGEKKLPVVLNIKEVGELLSRIRKAKVRMALTLIYACGLRLSEGVNLKVADVDVERRVVRVAHGKGNKDRYVPLPERALELLFDYWERVQPPAASTYLFAGQKGRPLGHATLQRALRSVVRDSDIGKRATVHTLRHSYATHLLEQGVGVRLIQELLGHAQLETTMIYTHVTQTRVADLRAALDDIMGQVMPRV